MDRFSFFFSFYGLILGLATAELLGGFAGFVRARALRSIEMQTALLAFLIFIALVATWIDAWNTLQAVSLDLSEIWAPVLIATSYYLAATVVFPRDPAAFADLGTYFAERKRFVVGMLIVAELLVAYTFWETFSRNYHERPVVFWAYTVPTNMTGKMALIALFFVRGRRANLWLLSLLIALFIFIYWERGVVSAWLEWRFAG